MYNEGIGGIGELGIEGLATFVSKLVKKCEDNKTNENNEDNSIQESEEYNPVDDYTVSATERNGMTCFEDIVSREEFENFNLFYVPSEYNAVNYQEWDGFRVYIDKDKKFFLLYFAYMTEKEQAIYYFCNIDGEDYRNYVFDRVRNLEVIEELPTYAELALKGKSACVYRYFHDGMSVYVYNGKLLKDINRSHYSIEGKEIKAYDDLNDITDPLLKKKISVKLRVGLISFMAANDGRTICFSKAKGLEIKDDLENIGVYISKSRFNIILLDTRKIKKMKKLELEEIAVETWEYLEPEWYDKFNRAKPLDEENWNKVKELLDESKRYISRYIYSEREMNIKNCSSNGSEVIGGKFKSVFNINKSSKTKDKKQNSFLKGLKSTFGFNTDKMDYAYRFINEETECEAILYNGEVYRWNEFVSVLESEDKSEEDTKIKNVKVNEYRDLDCVRSMRIKKLIIDGLSLGINTGSRLGNKNILKTKGLDIKSSDIVVYLDRDATVLLDNGEIKGLKKSGKLELEKVQNEDFGSLSDELFDKINRAKVLEGRDREVVRALFLRKKYVPYEISCNRTFIDTINYHGSVITFTYNNENVYVIDRCDQQSIIVDRGGDVVKYFDNSGWRTIDLNKGIGISEMTMKPDEYDGSVFKIDKDIIKNVTNILGIKLNMDYEEVNGYKLYSLKPQRYFNGPFDDRSFTVFDKEKVIVFFVGDFKQYMTPEAQRKIYIDEVKNMDEYCTFLYVNSSIKIEESCLPEALRKILKDKIGVGEFKKFESDKIQLTKCKKGDKVVYFDGKSTLEEYDENKYAIRYGMDLNGCNMYNDFYNRISVDSLCGNNLCLVENRLEIAKKLGVKTIDLEGKKIYLDKDIFIEGKIEYYIDKLTSFSDNNNILICSTKKIKESNMPIERSGFEEITKIKGSRERLIELVNVTYKDLKVRLF